MQPPTLSMQLPPLAADAVPSRAARMPKDQSPRAAADRNDPKPGDIDKAERRNTFADSLRDAERRERRRDRDIDAGSPTASLREKPTATEPRNARDTHAEQTEPDQRANADTSEAVDGQQSHDGTTDANAPPAAPASANLADATDAIDSQVQAQAVTAAATGQATLGDAVGVQTTVQKNGLTPAAAATVIDAQIDAPAVAPVCTIKPAPRDVVASDALSDDEHPPIETQIARARDARSRPAPTAATNGAPTVEVASQAADDAASTSAVDRVLLDLKQMTSDRAATDAAKQVATRDTSASRGIGPINGLHAPSPDAPVQPAIARAAQVELAVKLENATGQAAPTVDALSQFIAGGSNASSNSTSHGFNLAGSDGSASLFNSAETADESEFVPQVVRGLNAMLNQRGGVMTMRLDPPDLGELRVQMTISRGVVTAEFAASTPQAQTLLDKHMTALRHSLESQGLTVERLTVHAAPSSAAQHSSANGDDGGGGWRQHGSSQQHDAGGSESRGRSEHHGQRHWTPSAGEFSIESLLGMEADAAFEPRERSTSRAAIAGGSRR